MKQPPVQFAMLATGLVLGVILASLAVSRSAKDPCENSRFGGQNGEYACAITPSPATVSDDQGMPTPAPPRPEIASQGNPASREWVNGQAVFFKVESNQDGIEVGWASP